MSLSSPRGLGFCPKCLCLTGGHQSLHLVGPPGTSPGARKGLLLLSPSPFPRCSKPPPPHHINIRGDERLPQPICFFVQICSQFGNMIYKYCFCSQGLTLIYVRPDGWMQRGRRFRLEVWGRGLGWPWLPQLKPATAPEGSSGAQGQCLGIPSCGVKEWQGPKLSKHMAPWPKTATLGNKHSSPVLCSCLEI